MIKIAHASSGTGTPLGDGTGKEVCIRGLYDYDWDYVLHPRKPETAVASTTFAIRVCENDNIGYDQNRRNELYSYCKKHLFTLDAHKITQKLSCDCSSFATVVAITAGAGDLTEWVNRNHNCPTTSTMKQAFRTYAPEYDIIPFTSYKEGDICVKEGKHCVIIVDYSERAYISTYHTKDLQEALNLYLDTNLKVDGIFGGNTAAALMRIVCSYTNPERYPIINLWIQCRLDLPLTGRYDELTRRQVQQYQVKKNLAPDGKAGYDTITQILKDYKAI